MAKKQDKDMGKEVGKLGGFRPNGNRNAAGKEMSAFVFRRIEIMMIAPRRRGSAPTGLTVAKRRPTEMVSYKPYV